MNFITLKNPFGTEVTLCSFGASICDIKTLDKKGKPGSIVITPKFKNEFPLSTSFFGKTIGRTGGRIQGGEFVLNGRNYKIDSFDENGLHGGKKSLAFKDFQFDVKETEEYSSCSFYAESPDMESGYPGNLKLMVNYKLYKKDNKLLLNFVGTSDKDTLLNLSNHSYFNLNAESGTDVRKQELFIDSSYMERIEQLLPREIVPTAGIYSFNPSHEIGKYLMEEEIIKNTNGYDFPYILDNPGLNHPSVILKDKETGRVMKVSTTYPTAVIYTCNYCEDILVNSGKKLFPYEAVCIECMYHPNTYKSNFLNEKKDFLKKNKVYDESIVYAFLVEE